MSTYSEQINLVLNTRLLPKMEAISTEIARIEPYSYSSSQLEECKRQLDYYSMIYDFLYEYATGTEELESTKLVNIVRLLEANERRRKSSDFLGIVTPIVDGSKSGIEFYVNKVKVTESSILSQGTSTLTVVYTPEGDAVAGTYINVTLGDGTSLTSEGTTCILQNITIPQPTLSITVTVFTNTGTIFTHTYSIPVHFIGVA